MYRRSSDHGRGPAISFRRDLDGSSIGQGPRSEVENWISVNSHHQDEAPRTTPTSPPCLLHHSQTPLLLVHIELDHHRPGPDDHPGQYKTKIRRNLSSSPAPASSYHSIKRQTISPSHSILGSLFLLLLFLPPWLERLVDRGTSGCGGNGPSLDHV